MYKTVLKAILPAAALAFGLATTGCGGNYNIQIGDEEGVPLSEIDMDGAAPTKLVLAGPDKVVVSEGSALRIEVAGDAEAIEALRFTLDDDTLGIMRDKDSKAKGKATISVTMPPATDIVVAGSGTIDTPVLAKDSDIVIAGSGDIAVARIAGGKLSVSIMGSGEMRAAGAADKLDFNIAGSGKLAAPGLMVEKANVNIAGSGSGEFASDGSVKANVAGSGEVTVLGNADCSISAIGSGKLNCRPGKTSASAGGGVDGGGSAAIVNAN